FPRAARNAGIADNARERRERKGKTQDGAHAKTLPATPRVAMRARRKGAKFKRNGGARHGSASFALPQKQGARGACRRVSVPGDDGVPGALGVLGVNS